MALFHLLTHQVVDGGIGILSLVGIDRPDASQLKHLLHTGCGVNLAGTSLHEVAPGYLADIGAELILDAGLFDDVGNLQSGEVGVSLEPQGDDACDVGGRHRGAPHVAIPVLATTLLDHHATRTDVGGIGILAGLRLASGIEHRFVVKIDR